MRHSLNLGIFLAFALASITGARAAAADPWVTYTGAEGPGKGKRIVLVTGDEEYRSEESMPQLAKILAKRHGFDCRVLFAINKSSGEIDPESNDNIPGLEALDSADLMVIFTRFRELPDDQMKHIVDYVESGRPIVGLRTATHAFYYQKHKDSRFAKYDWQSKDKSYEDGFGRQVLGETWINHYGGHQRESTRGLIAKGMEGHPIVKGCEDIWGPSDVYEVRLPLHGDAKPLVLGEVLTGMDPKDPPNEKKPPLPVAWTNSYTGAKGKAARVFATTMGHGGDLQSEGFRRLLVNACYWALSLEDRIPAKADVGLVGKYEPNHIGNGAHKKGLRPADLK